MNKHRINKLVYERIYEQNQCSHEHKVFMNTYMNTFLCLFMNNVHEQKVSMNTSRSCKHFFCSYITYEQKNEKKII